MSGPRHHPAKRTLGQHFLTDPNLQRKIADAIDPQPTDRVLEIGPGTGLLTKHLEGRVGQLILVELDDKLAASLVEEYSDRSDINVVHADVLDLSIPDIAGADLLKVVGNIPYGITSPLLFHLLEGRPRPLQIVLTVQREVARRLTARPGTKEYGALTVGVQAVAEVERLFNISKAAFRPRPEVDSTTIRVSPFSPPPFSVTEESALRSLTRAAFSRRRKQVQNVLRQAQEYQLSAPELESILSSSGIDPTTRPDAIPVENYLRLARALIR